MSLASSQSTEDIHLLNIPSNSSHQNLARSRSGSCSNIGPANNSSNGGKSENIQVFLRMRPLNEREKNEDHMSQNAWRIMDNAIVLEQNVFNQPYPSIGNGNDKCFEDVSSNENVYNQACKDIVQSSLEGINGTIFMYGQTGAGKTFTMLGDHYQQEIREQAAQHLNQLKRNGSTKGNGNKTPLKGSFNQCSSNSNFTSTVNNQDSQRDTQVSPISNNKTGSQTQNITPLRKGAIVGATGTNQTNHRQTLSQIGAVAGRSSQQQTETPRHLKNSANSKNLLNSKIPIPLYKQQSQQQPKTRNVGQYNKLTGTQLFQTNLTVSNISEFGGNSMITDGLNNQYDQHHVSSNVLMSLQFPNNLASSMHTDRGEYNNYVQSDDNDDFQLFAQKSLSSARNLNPKRQGKSEGILIQSLKELFNIIRNESLPTRRTPTPNEDGGKSQTGSFIDVKRPQKVYITRCSYFEIYNDAVYDLLNDQNDESFHEPLILQEDIKRKEFVVKGLREHVVQSLEDCLALLRLGEVNRHYAETKMNHQSSRSHTLFRLHVESVACNGDLNNDANVITESVLNFVDLAGSEKVSNHQHKDSSASSNSQTRKDSSQMRVKEGQHINRSLFFLTQVIALKAEGKKNEQHIPYRNSPLTKILRSSLGGNSRTAIILCITPAANQLEQTFSTLRFGQNAKMIQNKVVANVVKKTSMEDEAELKNLLNEYEKRLGEIQKDNEHNNNKLQQVIESLLKEKDELNQRLIRANNKKLQNIIDEKARQDKQTEENQNLKQEQLNVKSLYLYDCGILNSYYAIDNFVSRDSSEHNVDKKPSDIFHIDYVIQLNDKLDNQNAKLFMNTLRTAKKDNRELRKQLQDQEEQYESLMKQNDQLNSEIMKLRQLMSQQQDVLEKQVQEKDELIKKYDYLQKTRYHIEHNTLQLDQRIILDIEQILYRGIQMINMEKGKREMLKLMNQQQLSQMSGNELLKSQMPSEVQLNYQKSEFIHFDDLEENFLTRIYSKKLDFNEQESHLQQEKITQSESQQNEFQSTLQINHNCEVQSSDEDSVIAYSQATTTKKRKLRNTHSTPNKTPMNDIDESYNNNLSKQSSSQQNQNYRDFTESKDISQITAINNQIQDNQYMTVISQSQRVSQQQSIQKSIINNEREYVSQSPINLKQINMNQINKIASTQSITLEDEDTLDEKTKLQEKCQIFQRQINNFKIDKTQKENSPQRTPTRSSINSVNMSIKYNHHQQLKTPTQMKIQSDIPQTIHNLNLDNDLGDNLRYMINNQGSMTTKAQQVHNTDLNSIINMNAMAINNKLIDEYNIQMMKLSLQAQNMQSLNATLGQNQQYVNQSSFGRNQGSLRMNHTDIGTLASNNTLMMNSQGSFSNNQKKSIANVNRSKYLSKDTYNQQYLDDTRRQGDNNQYQQQQHQQQQYLPNRSSRLL